MTGKTPIYATFPEKLAIKALLDERLHPVEGTGLFRYEDGWNDEVVAKTVREALNISVAAKIRTDCFGKLHNCGKKSGTPKTIVKLRVERLESQLELLLDWMQDNTSLLKSERDVITNGVVLKEEPGE